MRKALTLITFLFAIIHLSGQGIKGKITDESGQGLPFATIYVKGLQTGTATNENGLYQLRLPRGRHTVVFQYLGYETRQETVDVSSSFSTFDIKLLVEPIQLQEAIVGSKRENPAYTIMRKAIAKAKFHTQQVDDYTATVYIKGSGRLLKTPSLIFFKKKIEKALKEEGIDSTTAFVTESVSEIHYTRPNTYEEKVISVRTIGNDNDTSPSDFINSSFYEPTINGSISPLSPKAFAHYRFELLGTFSDRGNVINKIKVTPRSRGDQVFEGVIYIVDDLWSIHSLDLFTFIWGIKFNINQVYAPVVENTWMPINQIFDVTGSFFGFKFAYRYLANLKDYNVTLNPDLQMELTVIDDKVEKQLAQEADRALKEDQNMQTLTDLEDGKDVSRKQLRKLLKEYEKMEIQEAQGKADSLEDVVMVRKYEVDSMATKRDSQYWEELRPIPLTKYEVKGYRKMDSMALVHSADTNAVSEDSVTLSIGSDGTAVQRARTRNSFKVSDLIFGGNYKLGENLRLNVASVLNNLHFNTVDGYHFDYRLSLANTEKSQLRWSIDPSVRYAFSRKAVGYKLQNSYRWGGRYNSSQLSFSGGRDVFQLNPDRPIHPFLNDFMTLLFERNYMKVFEKDFVKMHWDKDYKAKLNVSFDAEWSERRPLDNNTDYIVFDSKNRSYTSNTPFNAEIGDTAFPEHQGFTTKISIKLKPGLKYRISNGRKRIIDNSAPEISASLASGWSGIGGSDVSYQRLELGLKHEYRIGAGSDLSFHIIGGVHLEDESMYFPDYKHFPANRTIFATLDPTASYRLLDYYSNSTSDYYVSTFVHYQFRKFLVTQIPIVRLTGIREGFFLNSLETPSSQHYMELGYNINYIFRLFRLEAVTSWQDFKYQNFGIRIGIATNLDTLFN